MRCKPGDLAIVVAGNNEAGRGRVVEVLHLCDPAEWDDADVPEWTAKCTRPIACQNRSTGNAMVDAVEFDIPDAWLRPISGVPVHDEQHDEVKEPA